MAGEPLVAVYVVNHNYGEFLGRAVDSVLTQDYSALEILVVDDASDDCSSGLLSGLERNPRITVIRHATNVGLTASCNSALRASSADFVMRLDADDYLMPSAVRTMADAIAADPDAVLVFPDYVEVDTRDALIRRVQRHDFNALDTMSDLPAHGACTMIRRTFLDGIGGYDESVSCQDGLDLWLSIGQGQGVLHIPEPLFCYRQHGRNLTRSERKLFTARAALLAKHVAKRGLPRPRVLGVIPVRGQIADPGSVPLRLLGGRPLIDWTVDEALACDGIDHVVVSSPDPSVLEHVEERYESRVGLHLRRSVWARLNVGLGDSLNDVLAAEFAVGHTYDAEVTLTVESPFRSATYIQQAINVMQLFDADGVVGVRRDDDVFYVHNGVGLRPMREDQRLRIERDDLFRQCSGMSLVRLPGSQSNPRLGHVLADQMTGFTVRTELDWKIAELLVGPGPGNDDGQ